MGRHIDWVTDHLSDFTQESYQPTPEEFQLPERGKHKGLPEVQREEARYRIREMIVQGHTEAEIKKTIIKEFSVSHPTAKKYLNKVYADINAAKADEGIHDRDLNLYLALERYKVALRLAMERKDIKNILLANQRIAELQGIMPTKDAQGPLVNLNVNHLPQIGDYSKMSDRELKGVIEGDYTKKIEHRDSVDEANIISAEEAEAMLRKK